MILNNHNDVIIETKKIGKEYNGIWVLKNVDFSLKKGEIHSIVGENGAGKSTFIKILSGIHTQSEGDFIVKKKEVRFNNTREAETLGVGTVHQEINLIPYFTVMENIFLGNEITKNVLGVDIVNKKAMSKKAEEVLNTLGVKINIDTITSLLDASMQRIIQVAKVLVSNYEVIIFDEPTTALDLEGQRRLLEVIQVMKKQNLGIIFISHDIEEVLKISDKITVFRNGSNMGSMLKKDATVQKIVNMMIGHKSYSVLKRKPVKNEKRIIFEVKNLHTEKLHNINFKVHEGEVLGIAGIIGAGKTEIAKAIFGIDPISTGIFFINGQEYIPTPMNAVKRGIAFIPEERRQQGLVLNLSVKENISLAYLNKWSRFGIMNYESEKENTLDKIDSLEIKTTGISQIVRYLSGGNQQKVVIGRWFSKDFSLGIFDDPTKGVDIKTKEDIYTQIDLLVKKGKGIIFISCSLPEIINISDRILVMKQGRIVDEFTENNKHEDRIMIAMLGGNNVQNFRE